MRIGNHHFTSVVVIVDKWRQNGAKQHNNYIKDSIKCSIKYLLYIYI